MGIHPQYTQVRIFFQLSRHRAKGYAVIPTHDQRKILIGRHGKALFVQREKNIANSVSTPASICDVAKIFHSKTMV